MLLKHSTISVIETKHWPFSAKHCISVNTSYRGHVVTWSQNGSAQKKRSIRHSNWFPDSTSPRFKSWVDVVFLGKMSWANLFYSYGHLSVITGYFSGIIHSINGVFLVLITGISGHNCTIKWGFCGFRPAQKKPSCGSLHCRNGMMLKMTRNSRLVFFGWLMDYLGLAWLKMAWDGMVVYYCCMGFWLLD